MLKNFSREKYRFISYIIRQGLLFLFFATVLLIFFYLIGNFQDLQDQTIWGIVWWLKGFCLAYLVIAVCYFTQVIIEKIIYKKANWRFFIFAALSFIFILPVYIILLVSESLVTPI